MALPTLYTLAHEYRQQFEALAELDITPEAVQDTLEGMSGDLITKAENTIGFMRHLEATAASIKSAEAEMAARRSAIDKRVEQLKEYVLTSMKSAGLQKIECPYFAISVARNPPSVEIYDADSIPLSFMRTPPTPPPTPDKKALLDAMKAGTEVEGCRIKQGERLAIK